MKTNATAPVDLDDKALDTFSLGRRPPAVPIPPDATDTDHAVTPEQTGIIIWGALT